MLILKLVIAIVVHFVRYLFNVPYMPVDVRYEEIHETLANTHQYQEKIILIITSINNGLVRLIWYLINYIAVFEITKKEILLNNNEMTALAVCFKAAC